MPLVPSMLETVFTNPISHGAMRDMVLEYMVPDYRPLYDSVVRELRWFGPDLAHGRMENLLDAIEFEFKTEEEADKAYDFVPESYTDDFYSVLRQIKLNTNPLLRISTYLRKIHYRNIREREAWIQFFSS